MGVFLYEFFLLKKQRPEEVRFLIGKIVFLEKACSE